MVCQGVFGLGFDVQCEVVVCYLNGGEWELVGEFMEIEIGKGVDVLVKCLQFCVVFELCKCCGVMFIIVKFDWFVCNVYFVLGFLEIGCDFVVVDML